MLLCYKYLMQHWRRHLLTALVVGVAVFAAFSVYADIGRLGSRLVQIHPAAICLALSLAGDIYFEALSHEQILLLPDYRSELGLHATGEISFRSSQ